MMTLEQARQLVSQIFYVTLPESINGAVQATGKTYIIVINDILSEAEREKTLLHELEHIRLGHFDDLRPLQVMEAEADAAAETDAAAQVDAVAAY